MGYTGILRSKRPVFVGNLRDIDPISLCGAIVCRHRRGFGGEFAAVFLDGSDGGDVGWITGEEDFGQAKFASFWERQREDKGAIALTAMGWANVVADMATEIFEAWRKPMPNGDPAEDKLTIEEKPGGRGDDARFEVDAGGFVVQTVEEFRESLRVDGVINVIEFAGSAKIFHVVEKGFCVRAGQLDQRRSHHALVLHPGNS
jgi:hypothetical protein